LTHAWFVHAVGVPQCPVVSHVCTALPEHCVAPGVHVPEHWAPPASTLPVQAPLVQGTALPHVPIAVHVCTPLPWHCVWPGAQAPVQAPPTHVWLVHCWGVPQVPCVEHCSTLLPVHCTAPGEQATHCPLLHTGVAPAHVVWLVHWPAELHCWTESPEHCVCPGAHTPVHMPPTQAWSTQHVEAQATPPSHPVSRP
jgi:hypothetical protein